MKHSRQDGSARETLRQLIDWQGRERADKPFLIDPERNITVSFGQLLNQVRKLVAHLRAEGYQPGDSIGYAQHNGIDAAVSVLGLFYGGYRAVSINLVAGPAVQSYVIQHADCRSILTSASLLTDLQAVVNVDEAGQIVKRPPRLIDIAAVLSDQAMVSDEGTDADINADSDGLLMYTSGTTGKPKGVVLSHRNLMAGARNVATGHQLNAEDRALCVLPLFHINGLCVTLLAPLLSGGSVVLPERFSTSRFWLWTAEHECTWFSVVPTQVSYLLHADTEKPAASSLRFGRSASAPLSPDVHDSFERRFELPLIETMGLTETAAQILSNPMPPGHRRHGSPGLPVGGEVVIMDDQGHPVSSGVQGEVMVRGDHVMQRYFNNVEATSDAITNDGWLHTGDLGHMDQDGYLFITGRLKELIIKGGENIAPREIDEALYRHPDVIEAAAFACTCDRYGQTVMAAVSISDGSALTEAALLALCEDTVGPFKRPDAIHFLAELPKGPSGKIQRKRLAELLG